MMNHAAIPGGTCSKNDPGASSDGNITGTLNVQLGVSDPGAKIVICAITSAVCGDASTLPEPEDRPVDLNPGMRSQR